MRALRAPGFILDRSQRRRYRSRASAGPEQNHRVYIQDIAPEQERHHMRCHSDD